MGRIRERLGHGNRELRDDRVKEVPLRMLNGAQSRRSYHVRRADRKGLELE